MTITAEAVALLGLIVGLIGGVTALSLGMLRMALRRMPASAYVQLEETIADMSRQQAEMRQQQAADHVEMRRMRGEIGRLEEGYDRLEEYTRKLARAFREATGQEPPPMPEKPAAQPAPPRPITASEPVRLQRRIMDCFSLEEVDALAFEMGLDGTLKGGTLEERSRSLVGNANRRGRIMQLIELCRRERPEGGF